MLQGTWVQLGIEQSRRDAVTESGKEGCIKTYALSGISSSSSGAVSLKDQNGVAGRSNPVNAVVLT